MKSIQFEHKGKQYLIRIGTNKQENWDLLDESSQSDIWFHVDGASSSYVILQTLETIKDIPREVIKRCACLCKTHSSSKAVAKCPIIYTTVKNVEKTKIVGQVQTTNCKSMII